MSRWLWLGGLTVAVAIALVFAYRGEAAASERATCSRVDEFVPAFCLNIPTTSLRRDTTVPLVTVSSAAADVRVETTVAGKDAAALGATVDRAVARVETLFARSYSERPRIFVFGTSASFATGARELFAYSAEVANDIAAKYGGIFDRPTLTIAINWRAGSPERMSATIAHELTHLMMRDITRSDDTPTWVDEGLATIVEEDTPGGAILVADETLAGRALASTHELTLASVDTLSEWHASYARFGRPLYAYAANAVRAMEQRIGWDGLMRLIEDTGRGTMFEASYSAASGESSAVLEQRLAWVEPTIVTTPDGSGARWTLVSLKPYALIDVSITGTNGYALTFTVATDRLGIYRGSFGATAAPGTYTIHAAGATATLVTSR
ncbi:MAG TPA: hypothetical protein VM052_04300 [Candidatus Limnocylindrales bacterium]|nr:hypothetical protein [Candidatus Limnocylindrales bacterium]